MFNKCGASLQSNVDWSLAVRVIEGRGSPGAGYKCARTVCSGHHWSEIFPRRRLRLSSISGAGRGLHPWAVTVDLLGNEVRVREEGFFQEMQEPRSDVS